MIYVGTDITPIARIKNIIQEKGNKFLDRVFTKVEQNICNNKAAPWIHYSGKYAAKEAVKKAILSSQSLTMISFKLIEINNNSKGEPIVKLLIKNIDQEKIKVSISHAGEYATAIAILDI